MAFQDGDGWWLESDNQGAAGARDSWTFGAVPAGLIVGRMLLRYGRARPDNSSRENGGPENS